MNAVSPISADRMRGFVSIAIKYPCCEIARKTRICRKMAPPKQLSPKVWITMLSLWLNFGSAKAIDNLVLFRMT